MYWGVQGYCNILGGNLESSGSVVNGLVVLEISDWLVMELSWARGCLIPWATS